MVVVRHGDCGPGVVLGCAAGGSRGVRVFFEANKKCSGFHKKIVSVLSQIGCLYQRDTRRSQDTSRQSSTLWQNRVFITKARPLAGHIWSVACFFNLRKGEFCGQLVGFMNRRAIRSVKCMQVARAKGCPGPQPTCTSRWLQEIAKSNPFGKPPQFHEVLTKSSRSPQKSEVLRQHHWISSASKTRTRARTTSPPSKMTLTVVVGSGRGYIRCHDWLAPPPPHRIVLRPGPKAWWGAWAILHDCALGCLWASGGQGWHAQAYMLRAACALPCAMLGCPEP